MVSKRPAAKAPADTQLVRINGQYYALDGEVVQTYVTRLAPAIRTTGVQQRSDDTSLNRFTLHCSFPLGIGWSNQHRDLDRGVEGLKDSTCWTHNSHASLAGLHEAQATATPEDHLKKYVNFKGDFWGFFEEEYAAGATNSMECRKFGATSDDWTGGGQLDVSNGAGEAARIFDAIAHTSRMFALIIGGSAYGANEELTYGVRSSTDGATWSNAGGTGWPDDTSTNRYITQTPARSNDYDDDWGKLLSFGNVLLAAIQRNGADGDGNIEVLSTTDNGSNWASDVVIPSVADTTDGPKAFVDWFDLDGNRAPVLITANGIYSISTANNTFELILGLDGDPANGRWARVANNGALYVGLGTGKVLVLNITSTGHLDIFVSNGGDGFVSARQGHVNFMEPVDEWMLVAYGGHAADKNASIFLIDTQSVLIDPKTKKRFNPWHHMYQHGTASVDIIALGYSTEDDATPRLHMALEGASASTLQHIERPLNNPYLDTAIKYQSSGVLRLPDDDMADPNTDATIFVALVDADDLSATTSDEYIAHSYGLDGAADTTVSNGNFLSGDLDLPFTQTGSITVFAAHSVLAGIVTVTSAAHGLVNGDEVVITGTTSYNGTFTIQDVSTNTFGIEDTFEADDATGTWTAAKGRSARKISHRLTLNRGSTNTATPKLQEFEFQAKHVLLGKRRWRMEINLRKGPVPSGIAQSEKAAEERRANIETLATKSTMSSFRMGRSGVLYVRVPEDSPPVFHDELRGSTANNAGERVGTVTLTLEEGQA